MGAPSAGTVVWRRLRRVVCRSIASLALLLSIFAVAGPVGAAEPVVATAVDRLDLTDDLEWCETTLERTVEEVSSGACRFRPMRSGDAAVGYSRSAWWLRLTLAAASTEPEERWLVVGRRRLQYVTYFVEEPDGGRQIVETGLSTPMASRPVFSTDPILPIRLVAGRPTTVLVRVVSHTSINLTTALWRPSAHRMVRGRLDLWETAAAGGLLAVAAFSLLIAAAGQVSQWSRLSNLWFGLASLSKSAFNVANSGLASMWLLPGDWKFDLRAQTLCMGMSELFFLLFLRQFVDSRRSFPRWETILRILIAAVVVATVWAVLDDGARAFQSLALTASLVVFAAVVLFARLRRARFPAAAYLLTAFSLNALQLAHRIVNAFAGLPFGDGLLLLYAWSYLLAAPLVPIGIVLQEEAQRRAMEKARAEAEARITFLARVSHELRTPLDTILGNAQLLSRPSGAPLMREGLAIIRDSGRHLLRMIDDLLDHARGVAGRLAIAPTAVDWPAFLVGLERSGQTLAQRRGNGFSLTTSGAAPSVLRIDEGRLRQVLDNLLVNAARHTEKGRIDVVCDVAAAGPDGHTEISFTVTDTGEGIAPADQERIFLPFERAGGPRTRDGGKGIGMGLTIARQLVEAMGGQLTVTSRPGAGASFRFSVIADAIEDPAASAGVTSFPSAKIGQGRTILIVEDEEENRRILAHLLRDCGFAVVEATSGRTARTVFAATPAVDLVITDQFMADGDGWSVLRDVTGAWPEVPVILVSAAPPELPGDFPRTLGFAAHFLKPLDHALILRRIADLLDLSLEPEDVDPSPPPTVAPATFVLPSEEERRELRASVADGRIGDVMRRAAELKRADAALADFSAALHTAAARLDFAVLAELLGED